VVIKSGEYKDIASPVREMTEEERALLKNFTDTLHSQFIADVARGRSKSRESIQEIADGRIFSGETARGHGLVDRLGNLQDAIEWAGRMGGIEGRVRAVYPPEEGPAIIRYLIDRAAAGIRAGLSETAATPGYLYAPGGRP
jgi:protease-4